MQLRELKRLARPLSILAGCLLAIGVGFACLHYSFAEPLTRTSYDLPFIWRANLDTHEIVLVYLDEESAKQLHQPLDDIWNRTLHVPLLERLTKEGEKYPRMVYEWWKFWNARRVLYESLESVTRVLVAPRHTKYWSVSWVSPTWV